ncbi:MAG: hypothetical protein ABSB42_23240 [Tepidisphaeraceae bacterium]|jgi:hypothetical protein
MDVYKIAVKIFASAPDGVGLDFVPIFHHWIQNQSVQGHRLIDVADYGHVAAGPGTVLVSSEANFYLDRGQNRLGLLYSRKLPLEGSFADRLRAVIGEAMKAAARLEQEPEVAGKLKFKTDEILIRLNDRLRAPPNDQTVAAAKGDVQAVAKRLYGDTAVVESQFTPQTVVEFTIRAKEKPALEALLKKI